MVDIRDEIMQAVARIEAENDNFLRALAMVAADGRAQIIPTATGFLGPARAVICLPQKQYDRLVKIIGDGPS